MTADEPQLLKCKSLPGGETLLGADHPSGVNHGSSTEMVALPAQEGSEVTHPPVSRAHAVIHQNAPVPEAHCPRRVAWNAINDAQHGGLDAVVSFPTFAELHLLCRHTAAGNYCAVRRDRSPATAKSSDFIS